MAIETGNKAAPTIMRSGCLRRKEAIRPKSSRVWRIMTKRSPSNGKFLPAPRAASLIRMSFHPIIQAAPAPVRAGLNAYATPGAKVSVSEHCPDVFVKHSYLTVSGPFARQRRWIVVFDT